MVRRRAGGFLIVESLVALAILAVAMVSFWQSWSGLTHVSGDIIERLSRERAIANARLLIRHQALPPLPAPVSESAILTGIESHPADDGSVTHLIFEAENGDSFWHKMTSD